jgi:hypothetical protein
MREIGCCVRCGEAIFNQAQAAEDAASAFHWNVVPVVHMRCRMTRVSVTTGSLHSIGGRDAQDFVWSGIHSVWSHNC